MAEEIKVDVQREMVEFSTENEDSRALLRYVEPSLLIVAI